MQLAGYFFLVVLRNQNVTRGVARGVSSGANEPPFESQEKESLL